MALLRIATNNGDVAGGEVMLLRIADAARDLGHAVQVIAPREPDELADRAARADHEVLVLDATGRRGWMRALRRWEPDDRDGLLWCNGLVPALATVGRPGRVVHLHQHPRTPAQQAALRLATVGARRLVVNSHDMQRRLGRGTVLHNWTDEMPLRGRSMPDGAPVVGYLGRISTDKGVHLLASAVVAMRRVGKPVEVSLAGDTRFVPNSQRRDASRALSEMVAAGVVVRHSGWADNRQFFGSIDVLVVPSVWPESFGLVAAEAMGAGVPLVVSDAGALPEVVGPDHPWIARSGDVDSLAAAIGAALASGTEHTTAARARWESHWSPDAGRARLDTLLREVLR